MEERQTNYTIMEGYELPSKGLVYDKKVNPHVELRSMTARDEMKRLAPSTTPLKTLADIIEGCMIEKPAIHVYDMCLGDYEFLLHKLRTVSYGSDYAVTVPCSHCGETIDTNANLDELEVKDFDKNEFENLKTFTLPMSGKTVTLKLTTPRLLEEISTKTKEIKRKHASVNIDWETRTKVILNIEAIDGEIVADYELESFVDGLMVKDFQKILNKIDELTGYVGVGTALPITCPHCGETNTIFFRFGPEFFRPSTI